MELRYAPLPVTRVLTTFHQLFPCTRSSDRQRHGAESDTARSGRPELSSKFLLSQFSVHYHVALLSCRLGLLTSYYDLLGSDLLRSLKRSGSVHNATMQTPLYCGLVFLLSRRLMYLIQKFMERRDYATVVRCCFSYMSSPLAPKLLHDVKFSPPCFRCQEGTYLVVQRTVALDAFCYLVDQDDRCVCRLHQHRAERQRVTLEGSSSIRTNSNSILYVAY